MVDGGRYSICVAPASSNLSAKAPLCRTDDLASRQYRAALSKQLKGTMISCLKQVSGHSFVPGLHRRVTTRFEAVGGKARGHINGPVFEHQTRSETRNQRPPTTVVAAPALQSTSSAACFQTGFTTDHSDQRINLGSEKTVGSIGAPSIVVACSSNVLMPGGITVPACATPRNICFEF